VLALQHEDSVSGGALAYTSHFYEFIAEDDVEQAQAPTHFAWQLEQGKRYELVVTTGGGLYRYRTGDCVQVNKYLDSVPVIEFLYRFGKTSSITGEKLTEQHVLQAANGAVAATGFKPVEYLCYPSSGEDPHYSLMLDFGGAATMGVADVSDADAAQWGEAFDQALKAANSEYADKCGSGRLGAIETYRVSQGALRDQRVSSKAAGVSDEQVKSEVLTSRLDCHKQIGSARLVETLK